MRYISQPPSPVSRYWGAIFPHRNVWRKWWRCFQDWLITTCHEIIQSLPFSAASSGRAWKTGSRIPLVGEGLWSRASQIASALPPSPLVMGTSNSALVCWATEIWGIWFVVGVILTTGDSGIWKEALAVHKLWYAMCSLMLGSEENRSRMGSQRARWRSRKMCGMPSPELPTGRSVLTEPWALGKDEENKCYDPRGC